MEAPKRQTNKKIVYYREDNGAYNSIVINKMSKEDAIKLLEKEYKIRMDHIYMITDVTDGKYTDCFKTNNENPLKFLER